ncbi:MAG: GIY-YIG nuclease family protein [Candidatus Cloacimonetes bacterium]|nr:GIY-YIG nuclease family protein [Candidatus Cloacimonadota bacterium]
MIEEIEMSPLINKVPVIVKRLSQTGSTIRREKYSANVIAEMIKNNKSLSIRYTYNGFNKRFQIEEHRTEKSRTYDKNSEMDRFVHKLRRISSRNELTYQVLQEIIKRQSEYLVTGNPLYLTPLTQLDLSKAISIEDRKIDNSWISRLISGLYVLTPSGEERSLKYFLPSQKQVNKFFIKDLLDKETKDIISGKMEKPYSDVQIKNIFQVQNRKLSVRSIAQYRIEMGIQPAKRRISGYKYPPLSANFSLLYPLTVASVRTNSPTSPGIYEFRLKNREIEYHNGKTPVIYIGSTGNIKKRLRDHLGKNTKNGRIRDFLKNHECFFRYIRFSKDWNKEEARMYQFFFSTYGAQPKCNRIKPGRKK